MPSTRPILSPANPTLRSELNPSDVEKVDATQAPRSSRQSSWANWQIDFSRIPRLLLLGYPTKDAERRYEVQQDWACFRDVFQSKVDKIVFVLLKSGLVLGADTNLLVSGDLRRMTFAAVCASMFLSLLSIIFGCFCLWLLVHPNRLKVLVRHGVLFYYLCGTPCLFGGASALAFFVAIGSWTWLDDAAAGHGLGGKICSVSLGTILMINAGVCLYLGASTQDIPLEEL